MPDSEYGLVVDEDEPLLAGSALSSSASSRKGASNDGILLPPEVARIQFCSSVQAFRIMETDHDGLTSEEANRRLAIYGKNIIENKRESSLLWTFLSHFTHLMAVLLWFAGILALVAEMPQLAVAIWLVNIMNGLFSFHQEFQAERATDALKQYLPSFTRVCRDGQQFQVPSEELVPGDIVILDEGEKVSADCLVLEASDLFVNQSVFTGESLPVNKVPEIANEATSKGMDRTRFRNLCFSGTQVTNGSGKALVIATGAQTEFGDIAKTTIEVEQVESPLQKEMKDVTQVISMVAIAVGTTFFLLSYFVVGVSLTDGFIFGVGMIVAFIPEGMLPLITLSLARGRLRMAKRGALVKRLSAVETLGSCSVICSDKTGTITRNEITVAKIWVDSATLSVEGQGYSPEGRLLPDPAHRYNPEHLDMLLKCGLLCNNAKLVPPMSNGVDVPDVMDDSLGWSILGDPTEAAILVAGRKGGKTEEEEEKSHPQQKCFAFSSDRLRMTTVNNVGGNDPNLRFVFMKGAPSVVLKYCTHFMHGDSEASMTDERRKQILSVDDRLSVEGHRVLAFGFRRMNLNDDQVKDLPVNEAESNLTFIGLMGMLDPAREQVRPAVEICQKAGIRVVMITGDNPLTAKNIAKKVGLRSHGEDGDLKVVTGSELSEMSDEDLERLLKYSVDLVFARINPKHKMRVVTTFQRLGHVVAVTGDGVNDAPALKQGDIGVAMGVGGSDVAREASEMILTDNNFASIVFAVEEGRAVYQNIKKFLTYILASNAAEALPFLFYVISKGRIPLALSIMLVLAIDLGTDMLPALALGADPPQPGIMDKPPRNLKAPFFNSALLFRALVWLGTFQGVLAMCAFYYYNWSVGTSGAWLDLPKDGKQYAGAMSCAFLAVIFSQIGNVFVVRTDHRSVFSTKFFNNKLIWYGIIFELIFAAALVYIPAFQNIFGTAEVDFVPHVLVTMIALPALILWSELYMVLKRCCCARPQKQ